MWSLKGPCLVLIIEWQPRWTNMCLSEIHRWLVHRYMCVSNTCHGGEMAWICCKAHTCDEGAHYIWDMTLSHMTKIEKIKTRLSLMDWLQAWRASWRLWSDGPHGGEAWARLGADGWRQRWKASEAKINEPTRSRDNMKWIISFGDWLVHVLHQRWRRWNGMRKAKVYL